MAAPALTAPAAPSRAVLRLQSGASLVVTLCVLVLIECVIVGTLHIATLERQLASTGEALLRLRLAADAVLAVSLHAEWPAETDGTVLWQGEPVTGYSGTAVLHAAGDGVFLLRAVATEKAPANGAATAAMLVLSPVLPPSFDAAHHLQQPGEWRWTAAGDSVLQRVLTAPGIGAMSGTYEFDESVDDDVAGVIIGRGDLRIAAGVNVRGVLLVAGVLSAEPGASVTGAVIAPAFLAAESQFKPDAALALAAIRAAGLLRARSALCRTRLPGF
jgi:hypothetical protein